MQDLLAARLRRKHKAGESIASITAYDFFTALLARDADADFVLVGDSLGNVIQGGADTTQVRLEEMIYHTRIVCRHFPAGRVVLDMPFGTFKVSAEETVRNCLRAFQESGCGGVKLEGADISTLEAVRMLSALGVPVIGHLGLLPQRVHAEGGYHKQGKTPQEAARLLSEARALDSAGAVALVLECVEPDCAERITRELGIPTIGIGSGAATSGQIIVVHDILGLLPGKAPSFAKRYANLYEQAQSAVAAYCEDVRGARASDEGGADLRALHPDAGRDARATGDDTDTAVRAAAGTGLYGGTDAHR
jgi:3-methyl-2-oxobutanoate hydroxymethyltransferase